MVERLLEGSELGGLVELRGAGGKRGVDVEGAWNADSASDLRTGGGGGGTVTITPNPDQEWRLIVVDDDETINAAADFSASAFLFSVLAMDSSASIWSGPLPLHAC